MINIGFTNVLALSYQMPELFAESQGAKTCFCRKSNNDALPAKFSSACSKEALKPDRR
jgi:hypothetical protein